MPEDKIIENATLPKKRVSPFEVEPIDEVNEPKKIEKKTKTSTTSKKEVAKKPTTQASKKATTTSSTKKPSTKKATSTKKGTTSKIKIDTNITSTTKIDPRTGLVKTKTKQPKEVKETKKIEETKVVKKTTKKKTTKKTTTPSQTLTIEPVVDNTPKQIVRPTPKKTHQWTKEEKVLYKQLEESFNTIANMTMVIEERTMDTKNIPNLTIGELHLIEMVNRYNNKPMTLIANKLHITVGAMTICLNRLVQKGYLLRTRDEMDRRVILLSITPEGKKVLKYHNKFHDDIIGLALDTLSIQQAAKVLNQFAYVLEYYYDPSIAEKEEKKATKKGKK